MTSHFRSPDKLSVCRLLVVMTLTLNGCASVNPFPDYERARTIVANATGADSLYLPGQSVPGNQSLKEPTGGMTRSDAVRIALMNNKHLQATMFEIGLSHADVVQAGLLSNPSLDGLLRFPIGGGNSTLEAGVLQSLFAIFRRPVAQRIAEAKLEKKILDAALLATKVATDTSAAYINALIAFCSQGVATENVMTAREFLFVVKERLAAGVGTQLEVNAAEAEAIEQELLLEQAKLDVVSTELALSELLGSEGGIGSVAKTLTTARPPDIPYRSYRLNELVELAEKSRLDFHARQIQVKIAKEDLRLERRRVLREMSVGASIESSGEGTEIGPALDIEIPLFDQNQAQVAKAKYRASQAQAELDVAKLKMQNEVRFALSQYGVAHQSVEFFEEKLVPLRTENLSLAREGFSEGKTGLLFVIESQRKLLQTRREYLARLRTYLKSITTIEKAVGLSVCQILRRLDVEEPLCPDRQTSLQRDGLEQGHAVGRDRTGRCFPVLSQLRRRILGDGGRYSPVREYESGRIQD